MGYFGGPKGPKQVDFGPKGVKKGSDLTPLMGHYRQMGC